jgi:hypothetical protein
MKKTIADLISRARTLESTLAASVEGAARHVAGSTTRQPLEIVHAVVDCVEQHVQPAGRGRTALPFNQIRVTMAAASPEAKAYLEVACDGPPSLHDRIVERLENLGCARQLLDVSVGFVTKPRPKWRQPEFDVELTHWETKASIPPSAFAFQAPSGATRAATFPRTCAAGGGK